MERFFLDSSAIIQLLSGDARGKAILDALEGGEFYTNVICCVEAVNGANLDKVARVEAFLNKLHTLAVGYEEARIASGFALSCRRKGGYVAAVDCLIAASAVSVGATLVTTDHDFERIAGVKVKVF